MAYEIGSVQASIKVSQVVNFEIAIPPAELLAKYDSIATIITEQIYNNEAQINLYYNLQKEMLQGLIY